MESTIVLGQLDQESRSHDSNREMPIEKLNIFWTDEERNEEIEGHVDKTHTFDVMHWEQLLMYITLRAECRFHFAISSAARVKNFFPKGIGWSTQREDEADAERLDTGAGTEVNDVTGN
jgi:hypothetical protein